MDGNRDDKRRAAQAGGPGAPGPPAAKPPAGARRRLSEQERQALLAELQRSGESIIGFARRHGMSAWTIHRWLKFAGAKAPATKSSGRGCHAYTLEERKAAVEAFSSSGTTQRAFAKLYGVTENTLSNWLQRYREGGPKALERRVSPRTGRGAKRALPEPVRQEIVSVARRFPDFGLRKLKQFLWRFSALSVSAGSIRKVRKQEGIEKAPPPARRKPSRPLPRRFERSRPGELWQSDITSFLLTRHHQRVYLTVFLDDFSRYVVSWRLELQQRSELVIETLLEGCSRFGKPKEVLTDQGRQYFAWRGKSEFQKVLEREGIRHVVARAHHPQTVGKCERLWETISRELWERSHPQELSEARERLGHFFSHYNHFRPHQGLDGLVPADRFFGAQAQVREVLEKTMTRNELALALGEKPRKPVFLVGQIGERQVSLHGEQGRLVVQTSDGHQEELRYEELGAPGVKKQEVDGERDDEQGRIGDDGGRERDGQAPPPRGEEASLQALAPGAGAGEGAVGERERGGEGESARGVRGDPGVVAGAGGPPGGGGEAPGGADPGVAALAAGPGGDGGGASAPAEDEEGPQTQSSTGGGPEGASQADRGAREGPRGDEGAGGALARSSGESRQDPGGEGLAGGGEDQKAWALGGSERGSGCVDAEPNGGEVSEERSPKGSG
jgi:transposase InsO family protein